MKQYLQKRLESQPLTFEEAKEALSIIGRGEANNSQIAAFLASYIMQPINVEELAGFREAMLDLAILVDLSEFDPMDVCGTGGDGKDTFNISTTSAFVVAGAGQKVAKHGNHGVSSSVGSSTVLEFLGVKFSNEESYLKSKIETAGICFLHAPLFHPAMRFVGPIRKELGLKTFFNLLGPLLNPAKVKKQLTGVYSLEVQNLYQQLFLKTSSNFGIVYGIDGYDEISLTSDFILESAKGREIISPNNIGFTNHHQNDLHSGATVEESAKILISVLENKGSKAQTEVVLANSATALYIADPNINWQDSLLKAKESLESGSALESFKKFI
ncbi:MAG: anthranilate phosphoribosyltransferase [Bacteroidota bacterium]